VPAEHADVLRYVARQPILDTNGRVRAYELLFRAGPEQVFRGDGNLATRTILDNTVLFGVENFTAGLPAFVNCTAEVLTEQLVDVLPPSLTVLEILETVEPTPQLVEACRKLKAAGFQLALDDFVWDERFLPLVELADYIKVDFLLSDHVERIRLMQRLQNYPITWLAEKVETQQEFEMALQEGFTLFQGYYFCKPTLMKNRSIPPNTLLHFRIMKFLQKDPDKLNLRKLGRLVKRDASLTFRLLRLVNSPLYAIRQEVRSIDSALVLVGEEAFRRIAILAITSEMNKGQSAEILRMSFVRGRCCELAARLCDMNPTEQYLLGMLSLLPAMLRVPIQDLIPSLPLRKEIRDALLGEVVPERCLLNWLERHELGNWEEGDAILCAIGLSGASMLQCYSEALLWAEESLGFA
jgi:EAL and modified HD-GYP domain-containing signal transduction protein